MSKAALAIIEKMIKYETDCRKKGVTYRDEGRLLSLQEARDEIAKLPEEETTVSVPTVTTTNNEWTNFPINDGWISVEDRLPEVGKYYLWLWSNKSYQLGTFQYTDDGFPVVDIGGSTYGVHNLPYYQPLPLLPTK